MLIQGRAYYSNGHPAEGVTLQMYHHGFGGTVTALADAVVAANGSYSVIVSPTTDPIRLEVRAKGGGEKGTPLTVVFFQPVNDAVEFNLAVPADLNRMSSEFDRLLNSLAPFLEGGKLGDAVQNEVRNGDLTYLHAMSGWDARLIALAASAERLSAITGVESAALYGMFRSGLPIDTEQLIRASGIAVKNALDAANAAGIIELSSENIEAARAAFGNFRRAGRRTYPDRGGPTPYGALLIASGLTAAQQDTFDTVIVSHMEGERPADVDALWSAAQAADLPVKTLRLTAQLAYLTLNSPKLTQNLRQAIGAGDLSAGLVGQGLYEADQWVAKLNSMSGGGNDQAQLASLIPAAVPGETLAERVNNYAADLARKVRMAYPTQVVRQRVLNDEFVLGTQHSAVKADVATALDRATAPSLGYSLGRTPLNKFLIDNGAALFAGMPAERKNAAVAHLETLHRLYQITPSDEAMKALLSNGVRSAHEVASMPWQTFLGQYGAAFPSQRQAMHTYRKAQQVAAVSQFVLTGAKQLAAGPPLPFLPTRGTGRAQLAGTDLIKQFPTLEDLFGSLDFCECTHCESVLGPAAYLVDLLKFLDPTDNAWSAQLAKWASDHGNATYPYPTQAAWVADGSPKPLSPYEALRLRRPDLTRLPLTCQNTNTVLPYIDIVNEIMEVYVAEQGLDTMPVFDTGQAVSEDLLAEPANITPAAYGVLRDAKYPMTLPFDLWLETAREFGAHFDTPFWTILEALRGTDELYPPDGVPYGRAAVFVERLGVPAAELALLTKDDALTKWPELYGFPTSVSEAAVLDELRNAKKLARRLRVTYGELMWLVNTAFVNPLLAGNPTLRKLGLDLEDVFRYRAKSGYPALTKTDKEALEAKIGSAGTAWLQTVNLAAFDPVLTLYSPTGTSGFDGVVLRHANGTAAEPMVFVLLSYLVRLWRRLGWSIDETDRALMVFLPTSPDPRTASGIGPALASAILGLDHYATLAAMAGLGRKNRQRLLALWSPLDDRRYADLFLAAASQTRDPALDHPLGLYLSTPVPLAEHLSAVLAALRLTAEEVDQILIDAQIPKPAQLTMQTVSTLYRYGLLAKQLRIPVADLVEIKYLSGLDPFTPPQSAPVTQIDQDHAFRQTIGFADVVTAVKNSGLNVADLRYLFRHRFEPVGPHRNAGSPPLALIRQVAAEVVRIRTENAVPEDPLTFTDDVLRQKLSLVFGKEIVDTLMAMWTDDAEYQAAVAVPPAGQLDPASFAAIAELSVSYDMVTQQQTLSYRGVLLDAERTALLAKVTGAQPAFLGQLLDSVQGQPQDFFDQYLLRTSVPGVGVTGFLDAADYAVIFAAPPLTQDQDQIRRNTMAATFLPYLRDQLTRRAVTAFVSTELAADPALTAALIGDPGLLHLRDVPADPLLTAYTAVAVRRADVAQTNDTGSLSGYLEVPTSGTYRFFVAGQNPGVKAELRFDHLTDPLLRGTVSSTDPEPSAPLNLRAGIPYGFQLTLAGGRVNRPDLLVLGEELPKGPFDRLVLYSRTAVDKLHRAQLLMAKTMMLVAAFGLTEREVLFLLGHRADFADLDFSGLPTRAADDDLTRTRTLFGQFLRLVGYRRLRQDLGAGPDDLVKVFAAARRVFPASTSIGVAQNTALHDVCALIAGITRRDPEQIVIDAAQVLYIFAQAEPETTPPVKDYPVTVAGLVNEQGVDRLWRVLAMASRIGVSPAVLGQWATPVPGLQVARYVRDSVKAKYEPDVWRRVVQPIADRLRRRRRDALADFLVHHLDFDRIDQLFEYFLLDAGTEPVVQISRIRLAISSVQTFVQRCLLNLEQQVSPSVVNAQQWEWMKRYRLWEANRKIFLWPENWLEPEFRDDKTHLFAALESTLLEGDLTNDRAESALRTYLHGLEDVSRLDIRAVHVEQKLNAEDNVLHVVGRTFSMPHKYYYRRLDHGRWTGWEPLGVEIDGDHLALTLWHGRLHAFWVTFLDGATKPASGDKFDEETVDLTFGEIAGIEASPDIKVQLNWTQRGEGSWSPRATSQPLPVFLLEGKYRRDLTFIYAKVWPDSEIAMIYLVGGAVDMAIALASRTATPTRESGYPAPPMPYLELVRVGYGRYEGEESLTVEYAACVTTDQFGNKQYGWVVDSSILGSVSSYEVVTHNGYLTGIAEDVSQLTLPFFYSDIRNTFFVQPKLTEWPLASSTGWFVEYPVVTKEFDQPNATTAMVPAADPVARISSHALHAIDAPGDWLTKDGATVEFGDVLIGRAGGIEMKRKPQ